MSSPRLIFHSEDLDSLFRLFDTSASGLSSSEAQSRLAKYGPNELKNDQPTHPVHIFLRQFKSAIFAILTLAALISFYYHHFIDGGVILFILLINACIGFIQEYKAEAAVAALKKLVTPKVNVYRDSQLVQIPARDLVVGDVMAIEEGNSIVADGRLISSPTLFTQEGSLTGESLPVEKSASQLAEHIALAERTNMVYAGTSVARGSATVLVVATADETVLGQIASELRSITETTSQFHLKSNHLSRQMALLALVLATATFIVGFFVRGIEFSSILPFTLATLVSAIPESLPLIFMLVLALTARRMASRQAIVRHLASTVTLGAVNTIITDKTGTLTLNQMQVAQVQLGTSTPIPASSLSAPLAPQLIQLLSIAHFCHRVKTLSSSLQGDPTELAYVTFARHLAPELVHSWRLLSSAPFDQQLKLQACLVEHLTTHTHHLFVVGAPESLLRQSSLSSRTTSRIEAHLHSQAQAAMRVIGFASTPVPAHTSSLDLRHLPPLRWVGSVGLSDPERPEAAAAIRSARAAGIRVIMATGDHPSTALSIARRVNISSSATVYTAQDLDLLSDSQLDALALTSHVFARMTPESKLRLAQSLQRQGQVIAMTGDGINDAPALKGADVGVSMGKVGTDVAREASDIVLADDNFATIVSAIEEGRTQLRNLRRTSFFLITTNVGEAVSLLTALFLGLPLPLLPKQILWLNLIGGGITDLALAAEPIHEDVLNSPPPNRHEGILNLRVLPLLLGLTFVMTTTALLVYHLFLSQGLDQARTAVFVVLSLMQLLNLFNVRSLKRSLFSLPWLSNRAVNYAFIVSLLFLLLVVYVPPLARLFEFVPLSLLEFVTLFTFSLSVLFVGELIKFISSSFRLRSSKPSYT